jgi:hypothetical protein
MFHQDKKQAAARGQMNRLKFRIILADLRLNLTRIIQAPADDHSNSGTVSDGRVKSTKLIQKFAQAEW